MAQWPLINHLNFMGMSEQESASSPVFDLEISTIS